MRRYSVAARTLAAVTVVLALWRVVPAEAEKGTRFNLCEAPSGPSRQIKPGPFFGPGVLLLRNGEVLSGKITRTGDRYIVVLPDGEIRVRTKQVEFCCRDLEEAYRRKRAAIQLGDVHEHIELAAWCQRQGLTGHAAHELADAMAADPTHPMIEILERRLKMPQVAFCESKKGPGLICAKHAASRSGKLNLVPFSAQSVPSSEDLDRLVRGVPRHAVEMFAQSIQPMLVNGCTAAGCHGPQSETEFSLFRIRPGRRPSRRLTQRNLYATLQWIDRTDPTASKLLTVPIRPHGTAKAAIFTNSQTAQYRDLVNWVYRVVHAPEPRRPASIQTHTPQPAESASATAGSGSASQLKASQKPGFDFPEPAGAEKGTRFNLCEAPSGPFRQIKPGPFFGSDIKQADRRSSVKRGKPPQPFVPADPFDPEIFNRRLPAKK